MPVHTIPVSRHNVHMDMLIFLPGIGTFVEPHGKSGRGNMRRSAEKFNTGMASFNDSRIGFFRQSNVVFIPFNKIDSVKLIKENPPGNFSKLKIFFIGQLEDAFNVP